MPTSSTSTHLDITRFQEAADFLRVAEPFLLADEALNGLILGAARANTRQGKYRRRQHSFLALASQGEQSIAAACLANGRRLLVTGNESAMPALAEQLAREFPALPAVFGPAAAAGRFADAWTTHTGTNAQPGHRQYLYKTDRVQFPSAIPEGTLRPAGENESELLARWLVTLQQETQPGEAGDLDSALIIMSRLIENREIYVWETTAGWIVCMAARTRPTTHGVSLNLVFTPQNERGRGYATACVASLTYHLLSEGFTYCSLFSDRDNAVSNHVYTKVGFNRMADFDEIRFVPAA